MKRIGDVAKELHTTTRTLRFWEDSGLIKSVRTDGNYRLYDDENYEKIKRISFWRRLGLSIESVLKMMSSDNEHQMSEIIIKEIDDFKQKSRLNEATIMICDVILSMLRTNTDISKIYNFFEKTNDDPKITNSYELISNLLLQESNAREFDYTIQEGLDIELKPVTNSRVSEYDAFINASAGDNSVADDVKNIFALNETSNIEMYHNYFIYKDDMVFGIIQLEKIWMNSLLINCLLLTNHNYDKDILYLLMKENPEVSTWIVRFDNSQPSILNENRKQFCKNNSFSHLTSHRYTTYSRSFSNTNNWTVFENKSSMSLLTEMINNNRNFISRKYNNCISYDTVIKDCEHNDCMTENSLDYKKYESNNRNIKCRYRKNDYSYSDYRDCRFNKTVFENTDFNDCTFDNCTIDGINIKEAIEYYKSKR